MEGFTIRAIDIGLNKQTAAADINHREKIMNVQSYDSLAEAIKDLPEGCKLVVFEKPFIGKNRSLSARYAEAAGKASAYCEMIPIPYLVLLGATWQNKLRFRRKLPTETPYNHRKEKYKHYRRFVSPSLAPGVTMKTEDEVAACCTAWHEVRNYKRSLIERK